MLRALRGLWGAKLWGAKRGARAEGWADARPESWHDDFWIWEGRVVVELMRAIRAAHAPRSAADAVLTAEAGMLNEQSVYAYALWRQARAEGRAVRTVDVAAQLRRRLPRLFGGSGGGGGTSTGTGKGRGTSAGAGGGAARGQAGAESGQAAARLVEQARVARLG